MTKLIVDNLHLSYDSNPILKGVSFQLRAGEVVSLLGASGSGKTTLLRAVAGLEQPSAGRILLDGRTLFDAERAENLPVEQRGLGLVFQSYALWPHRTVFDNIAYGLKLRRIDAEEIRRRVDRVLVQLGLESLAGRFPFQLSGGQQQRVAIARALVYNPPVILLDEPLSNLDAKLREEARAWLRALIVELGLSALCVTHDQTEAMAISDRILLLRNGRIEQEGTPAELYAAPTSLYSAEFMGSNNRLHARVAEVAGREVRIEGQDWSLAGRAIDDMAVGDDVRAIIRLERVSVADGPGENRIAARLLTAMYLGDRWEYLFDRGDLRFRAFGRVPLDAGEYWVEFPADDCWVFGSQ